MPNTYSLLCYTREATGREEANNEDIAYSMHLALRLGDDDGARWRPLNENYGIFSLPAYLSPPCPKNPAAHVPPRRNTPLIHTRRRSRLLKPWAMAR